MKPTNCFLLRCNAWVLLLLMGVIGPPSQAEKYKQITKKTLFNGDTLYEFQLENGFRVIHVPRHQAKVLTYQVWFDVGSNHEKLDPKIAKTGIAHLFEHMMFRGTKKFPDGKFDEITSRMGAQSQNASTGYYRTNYYQSLPSSQLEALMALESDRMENLNLTLDLFEKEKGAVVGELRRFKDSPGREAFHKLMSVAYKKAPYQFTIGGTEKDVKEFKMSEAQYFYKTYYAPNNATLIVVGDVEPKPLMNLVVKYYGKMKRQAVPERKLPEEPMQKKERKASMTHPQATSEILRIGYRSADINSADLVALELIGTHLSRGMEAQLRKKLVDTGVAVSASGAPGNKPDLFQFSVQMAEGKRAESALRIIDREVRALQRNRLTRTAFKRAMNQELLGLYDSISSNNSLAFWLGAYLLASGNYLRGFEIIEGYKTLTPSDVQRVAKKYLVKSRRSIVIVRPEKKRRS